MGRFAFSRGKVEELTAAELNIDMSTWAGFNLYADLHYLLTAIQGKSNADDRGMV